MNYPTVADQIRGPETLKINHIQYICGIIPFHSARLTGEFGKVE
jgi:hypothetical protein